MSFPFIIMQSSGSHQQFMERKKVESSQIVSIGYDDSRRELEIEFHSSGVYRYFEVPRQVYDDLMNADSKDRYFNSNIKDAYEFKKIGQLEDI